MERGNLTRDYETRPDLEFLNAPAPVEPPFDAVAATPSREP